MSCASCGCSEGLPDARREALDPIAVEQIGVAGHRLTPQTTLNARLSRHGRRDDREDGRDGPITDVSLGTGWVASPTHRIAATGSG